MADRVSLKVDSVEEPLWRQINLPKKYLNLPEILSAIVAFANGYNGFLATETMLIEGLNTGDGNIAGLVDYLQ